MTNGYRETNCNIGSWEWCVFHFVFFKHSLQNTVMISEFIFSFFEPADSGRSGGECEGESAFLPTSKLRVHSLMSSFFHGWGLPFKIVLPLGRKSLVFLMSGWVCVFVAVQLYMLMDNVCDFRWCYCSACSEPSVWCFLMYFHANVFLRTRAFL